MRFAPLPVASTASSTVSRGTQDASTPREIQSLKRPSATLPVCVITRDHVGDQPKRPVATLRANQDQIKLSGIDYTGHGAQLERDTYYLVSKKSRPSDLGETAVRATDLHRWFVRFDDQGQVAVDQPTVLIILDCCYSGSAGMEILDEALRKIGNPNTWVIASAGVLEYAQQGLFVEAFVMRCCGPRPARRSAM